MGWNTKPTNLRQQVQYNTVKVEDHEDRISFIESQGEIELGAFRGGNYNENSYYSFNTTGEAQIIVDGGIDGLFGATFEAGSRQDVNGDIEKGIFISGVVGVSNLYTKKETNDLLENKADKIDTYSKAETYTKAEVNVITDTKANTDEVVKIESPDGNTKILNSDSNLEISKLNDTTGFNIYGMYLLDDAVRLGWTNNQDLIAIKITNDNVEIEDIDITYTPTTSGSIIRKKDLEDKDLILLPLGSQFHSFSSTPLTLPTNIPTGTEWVLTATIPVSAGGSVEQYTLQSV